MRQPDASTPLRIGTRGSPLALAQAFQTRDWLRAEHGLPVEAFEIVVIKTTADRVLDKLLKEIGGKGLFTKELEEALLDGRIDLAVHCVKDMAVAEPEGLVSDIFLPREDPRDVLVSHKYRSLAELPQGASVGTSSMRRGAQTLFVRPDLRIVNFRGNVQSRLSKLEQGLADCTFLALAGLNRLGISAQDWTVIGTEEMLPAIGQGALSVQRRKGDLWVRDLLMPLHDPVCEREMACERSFLGTLEGSCQTPIAGLARLSDDVIHFRGEILRTNGAERISVEGSCPAAEAAALGARLARDLLGRAGPGFFDWKRPCG
ncbi:hydroxymethylbilane synthase [Pseudomonas sp. GX19020]|uniref:hydroxymethylbilane synthase n=1 Tax=Pseudomonas sp. GX19020 TaxID=2942277 RepID=UPI002018BD52|nr:hydroxymethylbilane synthase [Pseudomonas sp. GX19020]MCL4069108.1 hydroxymethylbilane synthase [Pseudomonas sp. GX19020]